MPFQRSNPDAQKCASCGAAGGALAPCATCHRAAYCSPACKAADASKHAPACGPCFSVAQLFDAAAGPAAAAARSSPAQAGTLLYDAGIVRDSAGGVVGDYPGGGNGMTFDRMNPDSPHAQVGVHSESGAMETGVAQVCILISKRMRDWASMHFVARACLQADAAPH